jgi:glycosyltransferase involved in cell wall biosynthesis
MLMNNLHISLTDFQHESRVMKEARSIISHNVADEVFIAALHEHGLEISEEIDKKINLWRFELTTRRLPKNTLAQLLKYLEFVIRVILFYRKRKIGMVNIHTLALLPLGVLLKYCYGSVLVYDTHELETETMEYGTRRIRKKLSKLIEALFIKFVDQVFVVGESIADIYEKNYSIKRPTVLLNCPNYKPPPPNDVFRQKFNIDKEKTIFLYQGALSPGRGIEIILDAFKSTQGGDVVIVFMGYGVLENEIKAASDEFDNIFYHPPVVPEVVLDFTASADVGISLISNTCLSYYYCMPNKLFEYLMAGLPIIVSNMHDMANFVNQNNVGVVADDETATSLIKAIDCLHKMDISELESKILTTVKKYSWESQEIKMVAAYTKLLDNK